MENEQVAICDRLNRLRHFSANPFAFTGQGDAMLPARLPVHNRGDVSGVEFVEKVVEGEGG